MDNALTGTGGKPYFASLPLDDFLPVMFERIDHYYNHVIEGGFLALWRASHAAAHSGYYVSGRINDVGDNGKFKDLEANEYRNLTTHVINMICAQKFQPKAQARNMDHESQQQTVIADGLAETLCEDKDLERIRQRLAETALYYGEAFCLPLWNKEAGELYTVDETPQMGPDGQPMMDEQGQPSVAQQPLHAGDIEYHVLNPLDVVRDATKTTNENHRWYITRTYANRYDLMATYPQEADRISRLPSAAQSIWEGKRPRLFQWYNLRRDDCDEIMVWTFMHDKCPALPQGRIVVALAPDLAITDDALPYRELPHVREAAHDLDGTIFGYTLNYDLLALQQGINAGVSAIATRMATFALPTIAGGPNCNFKTLGEGLSTLTFMEGEPEPKLIDFATIPPASVEFIKMLRDLMATYSGINNVARGQSEGGVTAASALALLEARAIQFVALVQKADFEAMKKLYTTSLRHFQDHAVGEVLVRMTGKGNRTRVESFTADKFSQVAGYTIGTVNALSATPAGKVQLIEGAKAAGVTFTAEQYWQVMTKGTLDPIVQGPTKEMELIADENETLTRAEPCIALRTDSHLLHIQEHRVVVADVETRKQPQIVMAVLDHIQQHEAFIAPPPMMQGDGTQPPAPGESSGTPAPKPGATSPTGPEPGGAPVKVQQAQPAKNPVTGQQNPHPQASA